jgi:hypothetical protein
MKKSNMPRALRRRIGGINCACDIVRSPVPCARVWLPQHGSKSFARSIETGICTQEVVPIVSGVSFAKSLRRHQKDFFPLDVSTSAPMTFQPALAKGNVYAGTAESRLICSVAAGRRQEVALQTPHRKGKLDPQQPRAQRSFSDGPLVFCSRRARPSGRASRQHWPALRDQLRQGRDWS